MTAVGREYLYFLTLTAPSDVHYYGRSGEECPCSVRGFSVAEWNATHSKRWNHFRTWLRQEVPDLEFFRGVEVQDGKRVVGGVGRMALHDHAMLRSSVPLSQKALRDKAIDCGFGHSLDLVPVDPGSRKAAYYVSKYVTDSVDCRTSVPWLPAGTEDDGEWLVDLESGEVLRRSPETFGAPYRTWSMSRRYGLTMAAVRSAGAEYAQLVQDRRAAEGLVNVVSVFGGELVPLQVDPPGG